GRLAAGSGRPGAAGPPEPRRPAQEPAGPAPEQALGQELEPAEPVLRLRDERKARGAVPPGLRFCPRRPLQSSCQTTRPPTMVITARPLSAHPSKGVFRLFDRNALALTVQASSGSITVT